MINFNPMRLGFTINLLCRKNSKCSKRRAMIRLEQEGHPVLKQLCRLYALRIVDCLVESQLLHFVVKGKIISGEQT